MNLYWWPPTPPPSVSFVRSAAHMSHIETSTLAILPLKRLSHSNCSEHPQPDVIGFIQLHVLAESPLAG